ncbi:GAF domain-containing protein, partial [bacterium]|nr:GAF domain-containing protein [bacterium]
RAPVAGTNVCEALPFLDEKIRDAYHTVFETGRSLITEESNCIEGHKICTETTLIPIRDGDRITRVVTIVRDATARRRADKLTHVQRDLGLALHAVHRLSDSLEHCIRAAFEVSGADAGAFYLKEEEGNYVMAASVGHSDEFVRAAERVEHDSMVGIAAERGENVFFATGEIEAVAEDSPIGIALREEGLRASALLPIHHDGCIIGCLGVSSRTLDSFPEHAREALRALAGSFGGVIASKRAEDALRDSEKKFRGLFSTSLSGIAVGTIEGDIVDANQAFLDILGRTMEDIRGRTFREFTPERWHAQDDAILRGEVTTHGHADEYEKEYIRKDGTIVPVAVRSWLIRDEQGTPSRIWGTIRNITAQKMGETARSVLLRISEATGSTDTLEEFLHVVRQELGRLMDTTNFYVALYDSETGLYSFPYHADEHDETPDGPMKLENSVTDYVRRTGEPYLIDQRTQERLVDEQDVTVYGEPSPIWLGMPLTTSRGVFGVVAVQSYNESELYTDRELELMRFVSRNISLAIEQKRAEEEHRNLEEQVRHAQKLESLGILAGGIAHDFNNLLTGILGNADMALMELNQKDPTRNSVKAIRDAAERAADLSRQMLAYSGKGRFVIEPIDLNALVTEMTHLLDASISKSAVVRYELVSNLPVMTGDATQIRQVIMNLMTNASDAIGDRNGAITVRTGFGECDQNQLSQGYMDDGLPEGTYVYLEIEDTGTGMDEDTASRIFDPFFTTKFTGRGLGLAAVLGIVRSHNGTIAVDSTPEAGTTFRVLFPTSDSQSLPDAVQEMTEEKRSPWESAGGTVLLVDDEPTVRQITQKVLERAGYTVITASDGVKALEAFRRHIDEIVCVLLDLTMPNMGGEEAFLELRKIKPDVRVILSSGYGEKEVADRFLGEGLAGFIEKPYLAAKLVTKVRDVLS